MPLKIIDNDQDYVNYKDIFNNFKLKKMQNIPLWVILLLIVAPILGIGLALALRKHIDESVKKRRRIVLIIFFSYIISAASILIVFSLSMYGNLSGINKFLKEVYTDWVVPSLFATTLLVLVYVFFRKDKKNVEKTKQKKKQSDKRDF